MCSHILAKSGIRVAYCYCGIDSSVCLTADLLSKFSVGIFQINILGKGSWQEYLIKWVFSIYSEINYLVVVDKLKQFYLNYQQKWSEEILCKPKLRRYSLIKSIYHPEHSVTLKLSRAQRSVCARLRGGILALAVETGRFHSIPQENRKRHLCDVGEAENEMHFLFHRP